MKSKRYVLLMTACIKPSQLNVLKHSIQRNDPSIRLDDYIKALSFWLNYEEKLIKGIVFIENSGFELKELKNQVNSHNVYNRETEFIQIKPNEIPQDLHYGYSELEMIDRAFDRSELIRNSDYVIKVTGRLFFPKLSNLLNKLPQNFEFLADCRDYKVLHKSQHYILTTLFITHKHFYLNFLYNIKDQMIPQKCGHIETMYFKILKPLHLIKPKLIIIRLPFNVDPVGKGAHWDVDYLSLKKR